MNRPKIVSHKKGMPERLDKTTSPVAMVRLCPKDDESDRLLISMPVKWLQQTVRFFRKIDEQLKNDTEENERFKRRIRLLVRTGEALLDGGPQMENLPDAHCPPGKELIQ
jgi:hypothetical protein